MSPEIGTPINHFILLRFRAYLHFLKELGEVLELCRVNAWLLCFLDNTYCRIVALNVLQRIDREIV